MVAQRTNYIRKHIFRCIAIFSYLIHSHATHTPLALQPLLQAHPVFLCGPNLGFEAHARGWLQGENRKIDGTPSALDRSSCDDRSRSMAEVRFSAFDESLSCQLGSN